MIMNILPNNLGLKSMQVQIQHYFFHSRHPLNINFMCLVGPHSDPDVRVLPG